MNESWVVCRRSAVTADVISASFGGPAMRYSFNGCVMPGMDALPHG